MTDPKHAEGEQPSGGVLAQAPTALIVGVTVVFLGVLAALVVIILAGKPTQELTDALRLLFGAVSSTGALAGTLYAASAARSAKATREQTNGNLDARIEKHVAAGVASALTPKVAPRSRIR